MLQQVEELEEGIIKEEILPALGNDIAPRLEPIKRDLVLVVEYHPGEPISVALSRRKVGTVLSDPLSEIREPPFLNRPVHDSGHSNLRLQTPRGNTCRLLEVTRADSRDNTCRLSR